MYRIIVRPLLFLFPPEFVHGLVSRLLLMIFAIPGVARLLRKHYCVENKMLERELFGLQFPNPVGIAAGFDKEAKLYNALSNFGFGHVEIGTVTPLEQKGNPKPRLFRLQNDKALINRMGFNNHGVESFVKNLRKNNPKVIIGGNIGKNTLTPNNKAISDYCYCFDHLFNHVDYFVINISCPNIDNLSKLQDKDSMLELFRAIQAINTSKPKKKPVVVKISPDLNKNQLDDVIKIVKETGLDGIIATNTTTGREHLKSSQEKILKAGKGGLSGKPLQDQSTKCIEYIHQQTHGKIPVIGVGGIFTADDAIEKLQAGASLVQVYTGFVYQGPSIAKKINQAMLNKS